MVCFRNEYVAIMSKDVIAGLGRTSLLSEDICTYVAKAFIKSNNKIQ